jgi:hypothetical protein
MPNPYCVQNANYPSHSSQPCVITVNVPVTLASEAFELGSYASLSTKHGTYTPQFTAKMNGDKLLPGDHITYTTQHSSMSKWKICQKPAEQPAIFSTAGSGCTLVSEGLGLRRGLNPELLSSSQGRTTMPACRVPTIRAPLAPPLAQ